MGRRLGINTRLWCYRYLVLRDGEQCARCYEIPTTQNTLFGTLDIDHIDGDPTNWNKDNLRLLCHRCNVILENQARVPPSDKREREAREGKPGTRVSRQVVSYKEGSTEMQANFLFELDFRKWILEKVRERGGYPKQDAIAAGAEVVGCSPTTTAKYLAKLLSSEGPLQEARDMLGDTHLVLKDHLKEPAPLSVVDLDLLAESGHPAPGNPGL